MKALFTVSATLALVTAMPVSAQLLGGGGGLGGGLGGQIGGGLGGLGGSGAGSLGGGLGGTLDRSPVDTGTVTRSRSSARVDRSVDRRSGKVSASGSGSTDTATANTVNAAGRSLNGSGSLAGSGSGGVDAQLVGTDAVGSGARQVTGSARQALGTTRDTASNAASNVRDRVTTTRDVAGNTAASASGMAMGSARNLVLAGSAAANGAGSFAVSKGMAVQDAKGRLIGTVQSVRSTGEGKVDEVLVRVGDRTAALPAANFSGSGEVLVSAMGKGDVKDAAH